MIVGICVTGVAFAAVAAEKQKPDRPRVARVQQGTGQPPAATEATAWIQYDDGTREDWGANYTIDGGSVGNKFTSSWGTFYCDQASAFMQINSTTGFYLTAYTGLSGSTLQGNDDQWFTYTTTDTTATGWFYVTTTGDFLGNTTFVFNNTAWIAAYYSTITSALPYYDVGIDTSGPPNHGFAVTVWSGSGYSEGAYNAMIRARFNGDGVPVELMGFNVE
jgi:hypothetical protein